MMISKKGGIETAKLILILAICFFAFVFLLAIANKAFGHECKRAQIGELTKVYDKLRYFKAHPGSSDTIYDFNIKPCVKKLECVENEEEPEKYLLKIKWNDGEEEMPANGNWTDLYGNYLILEEGTYELRVSFELVELIQ